MFIITFPQGVNVNEAIEGRLPLCLASDYGQLDVLNFLISIGADVDVSVSALCALIVPQTVVILLLHVWGGCYLGLLIIHVYSDNTLFITIIE